jgi:molybdate transport system regulatory protein
MGKPDGFSGINHKSSKSALLNPARIYIPNEQTRNLDTTQLSLLEQNFRRWAKTSSRKNVRLSRKRILLIFILIRYTGAQLSEVMSLDPNKDFDLSNGIIGFSRHKISKSQRFREVQISRELSSELLEMLQEFGVSQKKENVLEIDPGHVRRKFYERAEDCGFQKELGSPNAIRRARAIELMQSNMPLPVVQRILGHSTPSLTASLVEFSDKDMHLVARHFIDRESQRKTSARNTFFGKISDIQIGDIQSHLHLATINGEMVATVITNDSLERLGLKIGSLVVAEVKAPWVVLQKSKIRPLCTAENIFRGKVTRILRGEITTEFIVNTENGTELCSVVTIGSGKKLAIKQNDDIWVLFNSFAVILHVD